MDAYGALAGLVSEVRRGCGSDEASGLNLAGRAVDRQGALWAPFAGVARQVVAAFRAVAWRMASVSIPKVGRGDENEEER